MTLTDFNAYLHFDRCRAHDEHFVSRVLARGASRRGNRFVLHLDGV